jgi:hypothetical protein
MVVVDPAAVIKLRKTIHEHDKARVQRDYTYYGNTYYEGGITWSYSHFQGDMDIDSQYEQEYREQIRRFLSGEVEECNDMRPIPKDHASQYRARLKKEPHYVHEPNGWIDWGAHLKIHIVDKLRHNDLNTPARIHGDGCREFFYFGFHHRTDGPALEGIATGPYGEKFPFDRWWFEDECVSCIMPDGKYVLKNGTCTYWDNGKLSRKGGPAVIYSDGTEVFYLDGWPIVEKVLEDGTIEWYYKGEFLFSWTPVHKKPKTPKPPDKLGHKWYYKDEFIMATIVC